MTDKVLFIVHAEEVFRGYFPEGYTEKLVEEATNGYDRVIVLSSNLGEPAPPQSEHLCPVPGHRDVIYELDILGLEEWYWSWGYEPDMWYDDDEEGDWVIETSSPHEYTYVPPELRVEIDYFKNTHIYVAGGFTCECLQDWTDVLDYMGLSWHTLYELVY